MRARSCAGVEGQGWRVAPGERQAAAAGGGWRQRQERQQGRQRGGLMTFHTAAAFNRVPRSGQDAPSAHLGGAVGHLQREGHGGGHCAAGDRSAPLLGRSAGAGKVRALGRVDWRPFRCLTVFSGRSSDQKCRERLQGPPGNETTPNWEMRQWPHSRQAPFCAWRPSRTVISRFQSHRHAWQARSPPL